MTEPANFCEHCGSPLDSDAKFCGECGQPVSEDEPKVQQIPATPKPDVQFASPKPEAKPAPSAKTPKRKKRIFLLRPLFLIPFVVVLALLALAIWWPFKPFGGYVAALALSYDGQRIAAASYTENRVWNIADPTQVKVLTGPTHWVVSLAFHPQGNVLAGLDDTGRIALWDTDNGTLIEDIATNMEGFPLGIAFSPDGNVLLGMTKFNAPEGAPPRINPGVRINDRPKDSVNALFSGKSFWLGQTLLNPGGRLDFWDIRRGLKVGRVEIEDSAAGAGVASFAFNAEGSILAYGTTLGKIVFWDLWGRRQFRSADIGAGPSAKPAEGDYARCLAFNEAGNRLVAMTGTRLLAWTLWDMKLVADLDLRRGPYKRTAVSLAIDTAGTLAVVGWSDGQVELWDLKRETRTAVFSFIEGFKRTFDIVTNVLKNRW